MKYFEKVNLNDEEIAQAENLHSIVHAEDKTYNDIYLSNQYNYFNEMPTFVYAVDNSKMVGLTMLYADEKPGEEVEVHLEVAPDYRRQGIAREMTKRAQKIMTKYGYNEYCFISEKAFIDKNSDFLANTKLKIDNLDYHMVAVQPKSIAENDELNHLLTVREMNKSDINVVSKQLRKAFGGSLEFATKYAVETFKDPEKISFVLTYQDEIAGYCAVDLGSYDYFFGLYVSEDFRGHGYATFFVKKMMALLQKRGSKEFVLDVEPDNIAAIHAYQNAGFEIKSETVYLK